MTIDAKTAILLIKAITWCNHNWYDAFDWLVSPEVESAINSKDFLCFCKDVGIKEVTLNEDR